MGRKGSYYLEGSEEGKAMIKIYYVNIYTYICYVNIYIHTHIFLKTIAITKLPPNLILELAN